MTRSVTAARPATGPALEFDRFSYRYSADAPWALDQIDLSVAPGDFVLLCGASGSGKSTLLRAISGLVPHHFGGLAEGEAAIAGHDLRETGAGELAAVCGTVFQDPESQSVMDCVRNEIAFPLENLCVEQAQIALAVAETAASLGITHLLDRRTDELSGGELQRVALAAALATRPKVLVLDEPTSQLDPVAADELLSTLHRLCGDNGTTIMLAEHRIDRALEFADRVLAFEAGRIAIDAPPQEFLVRAAASQASRPLLPPLAELFDRAGIDPLPVSAKAARRTLAASGREARPLSPEAGPRATAAPVLTLHRASYSYRGADSPALDRANLELFAGQRAVLLGANGSGKSTLLRVAHGVQRAAAGRVERAGEVALLLQNPNDYLIHERVAEEAPLDALERFGLAGYTDRDPRDLSGGERQRLALAIVMQSDPAALLLDEPTRGMDATRKAELAQLLIELTARGTAVLVATHDTEFAVRFADYAFLLDAGQLIAQGSTRELLTGGGHFSTTTARLLPGCGALTPEEGAQVIA